MNKNYGKLLTYMKDILKITNLVNNFRYFIKLVAGNLYIRICIYAASLVNVVAWLASYHILTKLDHDLIILHYNVDFGLDYIGQVEQIFAFPLLGLGIIVVNILICILVRRVKKIELYMLLITAITANFFLLMALGSVYLINIR